MVAALPEEEQEAVFREGDDDVSALEAIWNAHGATDFDMDPSDHPSAQYETRYATCLSHVHPGQVRSVVKELLE